MRLKYIFYFEMLLNTAAIIQFGFFPEAFYQTLVGQSGDLLAWEMGRWYAVLLFFLTYLYAVALHQRHWPFFRHTLIALLIGDLLHLPVTYTMAQVGGWSPVLYFTLGFTALFATTRILALRNPRLIGRPFDGVA